MNHIMTDVVKKVQIKDDEGKHVAFLIMSIAGKTGTIGSVEGKGAFFYVLRDMPQICEECGVDKVISIMELRVYEKFKKHINHLDVKINRQIKYKGMDMLELEITQG